MLTLLLQGAAEYGALAGGAATGTGSGYGQGWRSLRNLIMAEPLLTIMAAAGLLLVAGFMSTRPWRE